MSFAANHPVRREQAKVLNRFDITQRLVARLKHEEAVIGGIGYTNFDLWGAGQRPQNFYMLGSMGLAVPYQVPVLMMVSERGTLGEFNIGQALVAHTMRPVLQTLNIEHPVITRHDELEFTVDRSITQAVATQAPCCFILSPLLTGGKVFAA